MAGGSLVVAACSAMLILSGSAHAQATNPSEPPPRFYAKLDMAGVIFHESGKISVAGNRIPGASIGISNNATGTFNLGYFVMPWLSIDLFAGLPPHAAVTGTGNAAALGTAATTNYGPLVLSVLYHYNGLGAFRPFIGPGVNYTLFLNTRDGNMQNAKVASTFGAAATLGVDYDISRNWGLNVAATHILLSTKAKGTVGGAPVTVKVTADPTVIVGGLTYRF